tara:strand:+ start:595 stop:1008 length:414 start_codon:yes stop_codon:yes gene_type:complete
MNILDLMDNFDICNKITNYTKEIKNTKYKFKSVLWDIKMLSYDGCYEQYSVQKNLMWQYDYSTEGNRDWPNGATLDAGHMEFSEIKECCGNLDYDRQLDLKEEGLADAVDNYDYFVRNFKIYVAQCDKKICKKNPFI